MQYTFDDGSTIEYTGGTVSSTPTPPGWALTDYSQNFAPNTVSPGANSWMDVLKYGIGRTVDMQVAKNTPQNTAVRYAAPVVLGGQAGAGTVMGISTGTLLIGALVAGGLFAVVKMMRKG